MGIAAVIFGVLAIGLGVGWWFERSKSIRATAMWREEVERGIEVELEKREALRTNAKLEAEIIRLRRIPLTQEPDRADNTLIKARSAAQVRQITEATFGRMPEFEQAEEQVN
jgi:C4-dicarboxylate-specific signal transduction histidine kinase